MDQWQLKKLALVTTKAEVHYYVPGLPAAQHASAWGNIHSSVDETIGALLELLSDDATVAVIPEGPYVLALTDARERAECP
jgi:lactate racemase